MKHLYALFAALGSGLVTHSQITIGAAEMPHAGDELIRVRAVTNPFINYSATGESYTWDFPNLAVNQGDTASYQTVASTNFVYAIIYADLFFNPNRANHARPGVDIPFSNLLPIANPFTFRYRSNSVYRTVGYGVELSGLSVPILFDEQDVIYELPLTFGDTSDSHSSYHVEIPNAGYYGFEQDRENVVDGWGAISTPGGSWDVLRVKTTLNMRDSINGFAINRPVAREYKWLAQGLRVPVLQVNTTTLFGAEVVTGIWYFDVPRTINVEEPLAATLCPGADLEVYYTATGSFNNGGFFIPANQFVAELSDAIGDFTNPVVIGSVQSTESGSITATIPPGTTPGSGYRIRIVSTSPDFIGEISSTAITIGGATTAAITADTPTQLCSGQSVLLTAVGGPGYQWRMDGVDINGATEATLTAAAAGDYTVVVSNGCGTASSNAITVSVSEPPTLSVDITSATICAGVSTVLTANDLTGEPGTTYQWFLNNAPIAGANTLTLDATLAGQYTMEAMSAGGCASVTEGIFLSIDLPAAPELTANGATAFCEGGSVELTASSATATSYAWALNGTLINGADGAVLNADATGLYTVSAITMNGCSSEASEITVTENAIPAAPVITPDGSTSFCEGGIVTLSIPATTGQIQWWVDGSPIPLATEAFFSTGLNGSYAVAVTSMQGCASAPSEAVVVQVSPLPSAPGVLSTEPTTFCTGGGTTLIADFIDGVSYQWMVNGAPISGAEATQYSTQVDGSYTVQVVSAQGCSATSDPAIEITVLDAPAQPVISQAVDGLDASGSGSFQWYLDGAPIPGATSSFYEPTANGYYTVLVTDANGCSSLSEAWFFLTTSVAEAVHAGIQVVPNPSTGLLFLELSSNAGAFEIRDITGKRVISGRVTGTRTAIDLSDAADGAYFLCVAGDVNDVVRFIIAR